MDANEAMFNGAGDGSKHLLIINFESADHDMQPWLDRALEIAKSEGGEFELPKEKDAHKIWSIRKLEKQFHKSTLLQRGFNKKRYSARHF